MVELELLERGERAVALLREASRRCSSSSGGDEPVVACGGLAQERQSDKHDARDREHRADDERSGQMRTAAARVALGETPRFPRVRPERDQRAADEDEPASQSRFTSGFCSAFRSMLPFAFTWSAIRKRSPPVSQS